MDKRHLDQEDEFEGQRGTQRLRVHSPEATMSAARNPVGPGQRSNTQRSFEQQANTTATLLAMRLTQSGRYQQRPAPESDFNQNTPQHQGVGRQPQGFAPQPQGLAHQHQGLASQHQGLAYQHQSNTPQHQGLAHQHQSNTPQHQGLAHQHQSNTPQHQGVALQQPQIQRGSTQDIGQAGPSNTQANTHAAFQTYTQPFQSRTGPPQVATEPVSVPVYQAYGPPRRHQDPAFVRNMTCWYWSCGHCNNTDEGCLYAHRWTGRIADPPSHRVPGLPAVAGRNAQQAMPVFRHWQNQPRTSMAVMSGTTPTPPMQYGGNAADNNLDTEAVQQRIDSIIMDADLARSNVGQPVEMQIAALKAACEEQVRNLDRIYSDAHAVANQLENSCREIISAQQDILRRHLLSTQNVEKQAQALEDIMAIVEQQQQMRDEIVRTKSGLMKVISDTNRAGY
ncbi:hypothetical protein MMC09_003680 [Bachmanniomyces sp. S44760]|nr:hypothetical protein [Bachmanniomyces sp. S44760]